MSDELERLRADLEVLERYFCDGCARVVQNEIAALESAADRWREAKSAILLHIQSGGNKVKAVAEYALHLQTENSWLTARVAELEAALKRIATVPDCGCVPCRGQCDSAENLRVNAEEIREIARVALQGVKPIADMQPPFEGPIVGIEPVLDPARVLMTATEILCDAEFDRDVLENAFTNFVIDVLRPLIKDAGAYRLKGAGDDQA